MNPIGIVIPTYNEEEHIETCLQSLSPFLANKDMVVLSDAGSQDHTVEKAKAFGLSVIHSPKKERGSVISHGIHHLLKTNPSLHVILIAHADMRFPEEARDKMLQALKKHPNAVGGCFGHQIQSSSKLLSLVQKGNNSRARFLGISYGDQAQFFKPRLLKQAGGFPSQPTLEDVELSFRMNRMSSPLYLNCPVHITDRHWHNGIVRTTLRNWGIVLGYILRKWSKQARLFFRRKAVKDQRKGNPPKR